MWSLVEELIPSASRVVCEGAARTPGEDGGGPRKGVTWARARQVNRGDVIGGSGPGEAEPVRGPGEW